MRSENHPLLQDLLDAKGMTIKGAYAYSEVAEIFDCSIRSLQQLIRDGRLMSRNLPGRKKFLSVDLEDFLRTSVNKPNQTKDQNGPERSYIARLEQVSGNKS